MSSGVWLFAVRALQASGLRGKGPVGLSESALDHQFG
jgi:hypothetical protein